jgi:hypothetical protein
MMDPHDLTALVGLSETLVGHPHLASLREQVNRELADANREASDHLAEVKAKEKEAQAKVDRDRAQAEAKANAQARAQQAGAPTPARNTYEGMPGPAEPKDETVQPKAIPSDRTPWVEPKVSEDQSQLSNINRRP